MTLTSFAPEIISGGAKLTTIYSTRKLDCLPIRERSQNERNDQDYLNLFHQWMRSPAMLRVLVPIEFSFVGIHVFLHKVQQLFIHVLHVRRKGLEVNWQETYMEWMEIRECAENFEIKLK